MSECIGIESPIATEVNKGGAMKHIEAYCLTSSGERSRRSLPWTTPALLTRIVG
jgi:hypothetical protein